jgi:hypothetical protein
MNYQPWGNGVVVYGHQSLRAWPEPGYDDAVAGKSGGLGGGIAATQKSPSYRAQRAREQRIRELREEIEHRAEQQRARATELEDLLGTET